jgi:hypothetical protein
MPNSLESFLSVDITPKLASKVCCQPNPTSQLAYVAVVDDAWCIVDVQTAVAKPRIDMEVQRDSQHILLNYNIPNSGEYLVSIRVNGEHIANSPFDLYVIAGAEEQEAQQQRKRQALRALSNSTLARRLLEMPSIVLTLQSAIRRYAACKQRMQYGVNRSKHVVLGR